MTAEPPVPPGTTNDEDLKLEELQLATRNHGMPLEALAYDVTPIGLHYLLTHYDNAHLDPGPWRLRIGGLVERPVSLSLDDLRARPAVTRRVTMECAGNGRARMRPRPVRQPWLHEAVSTGEWTGTPAADLIEEAGLLDGVVELVFTGADRGVDDGVEHPYARSLDPDELRRTGALFAYELNGIPLPPQHGAPVRLVVPTWYGMASVKWLTDIEAVDTPFDGYQQARAYRVRQRPEEPGEPITRLSVNAMLVPPGVPDYLTRRRLVDRGTHVLRGRAWSGHGEITSVEVSTDSGHSWRPAVLEQPSDPAAWTGWWVDWQAGSPGDTEVCCRATDAAGNVQPDEPSWNLGGYLVNAVHRVPVTVR